MITGPKEHAESFIEGISLLANMRLCPNVPAQHAIQVALGGHQSIEDLVLPGGRLLEQRDVAWTKLNEIPGVSCVKPEGALYAFPRLDPEVYDIQDDEQLVLDLLLQEKILVTQGTGFNWPTPITCASSRCRGRATSPTRSSGSATSWSATGSSVQQRLYPVARDALPRSFPLHERPVAAGPDGRQDRRRSC